MEWNLGDVHDALAEVLPADAPAIIHDDTSVGWQEFTRRGNNVGRFLLENGLNYGDKVAFYMRNVPAYSETMSACFKARLVHVNINYRYVDEELKYVIANSDAVAVVYSAEFADFVLAIRDKLPEVKLWIEVADGEPALKDVADYETIAQQGSGAPLEIKRSPEDLLFLYTGGTTGMPKGVMWTQSDLFTLLSRNPKVPPAKSLAELVARVGKLGAGPKILPACPLMHGTGLITAISAHGAGGAVVTVSSKKLDPAAIWQSVTNNGVNSISIVGDAFAKPLLKELQENPDRYELKSLKAIVSSGLMWSPEIKEGLLECHPRMALRDSFGSSEALGFGDMETTAGQKAKTAKFRKSENCKVFTEDHREIKPGTGEVGFVALSGPMPVGYYKDPKKTESTFPTINGVRYSIPGDWCSIETDGTLTLLGRGSVCINSGGEKIYPEEIEEVIKKHPATEDVLVVGVPDEKWGQAVTAVVQLVKGETLTQQALVDFVKQHLAAYKAPKHVLFHSTVYRAVNGKSDYKRVTRYAKETLKIEPVAEPA
ncbi:MAG: acyl-CoA synthetase [Gammaproteobacteria bacterium]|nr:MAG: acyl-CoA synthetase [Gammaproteobacteria bacterium]